MDDRPSHDVAKPIILPNVTWTTADPAASTRGPLDAGGRTDLAGLSALAGPVRS
jgi:hypothetical protein